MFQFKQKSHARTHNNIFIFLKYNNNDNDNKVNVPFPMEWFREKLKLRIYFQENGEQARKVARDYLNYIIGLSSMKDIKKCFADVDYYWRRDNGSDNKSTQSDIDNSSDSEGDSIVDDSNKNMSSDCNSDNGSSNNSKPYQQIHSSQQQNLSTPFSWDELFHNEAITNVDLFLEKYGYYGLELPIHVFWYAYIWKQGIVGRTGSYYNTGSTSNPSMQKANLSSICYPTAVNSTDGSSASSRRIVLLQLAKPDHTSTDKTLPLNPFELVMAYEAECGVFPVLSDLDCFLVGTRRVMYELPLDKNQEEAFESSIKKIEGALKTKND